ncbi:dTDP-4-dehydrorhamnose reductase, partial [uncultured Eudoraea sp.]|uniref:dTDP-4-dehydrorhamnose reductase n=1 Tax=uncultured Eudoraea sp. TaxID=1035614 RepID=UPI002628BC8D
MKRVLVSGSEGQLGKCLQKIFGNFESLDIKFMDARSLDITNTKNINSVFQSENYDYCINCAAYTNVEQAEKIPERAFALNADGVKNIATACKNSNVVLIHISTDYVFDGESEEGYLTTDLPNPINQYGMSKLAGENYIKEILEKYFIIRTSWLYSEFGHNFYKTILKKAQTERVLYITDEQTGCPTDANNLGRYILNLISMKSEDYGIHHFTDGTPMTWYDFAKQIIKDHQLESKCKIEKAENYRTFAKRPK